MIFDSRKFKFVFAFSILIVVLLCSTEIFAMQSSNYIINWDSINAGGTDNSESANYKVRDTMGQMGPGRGDSSNWTIRSGYRQVNDEPKQLTFSVQAQNNSTQVSYSAFNSTNFTVTVSDASGYSQNDLIVVVENEGPGQLIAIGEIENIATNVITVDQWSGDQGSMSASPAGGDDYVYKLDTNYISLGKLTSSVVSTGVAATEITTNAPNGYEIYIKEDHNLQIADGPADINDVSDGTVSAGSEEYGIETSGDNAQGSGDWAITSSEQQTANSSARSSEERVGVIYKASKSATQTAGGEYRHVTSYYAIANF